MDFNQLLKSKKISPSDVIVMRHRPKEERLAKVIGWLAVERPELFNAYQQTQGERVERAMQALIGRGYVASFIAHGSGRALFIGLYKIGKTTPLSFKEYWEVPAYQELKQFDMVGFQPEHERNQVLWFDMPHSGHFSEWKGKLIVSWPGPERSWWRRAERNTLPIIAINEESLIESEIPKWDSIKLSWSELRVLPKSWKSAMSQWRGIYYIFDESDRKGYVGSAYGRENIYGRWSDYAATGHGGNSLLKGRNKLNFKFTILELVSPSLNSKDVIRIELSWKERLHTLKPNGLNES